MVGSLILVAVVNPYFLIPVGLIGCIFMLFRMVFLKSSKNIKRLEGISKCRLYHKRGEKELVFILSARSPVFTHLNATLQGLTTIRAYGAQDILRREFDKHQDLHSSAWYMYIAASSAFGFVLDICCFVFTALVTFNFLLISDSKFYHVSKNFKF